MIDHSLLSPPSSLVSTALTPSSMPINLERRKRTEDPCHNRSFPVTLLRSKFKIAVVQTKILLQKAALLHMSTLLCAHNQCCNITYLKVIFPSPSIWTTTFLCFYFSTDRLIRLEHKEILARYVLVLAMAKDDKLHRYSQNSEEMEERIR